ncbi:MAG: hypothetical protein V2I36_05435 [Desulfopila sp.]|nr:hypothetical protein [Desulfopila sp.]
MSPNIVISTVILLFSFQMLFPVFAIAVIVSPLTNAPYTVSIEKNRHSAQVGEPYFIHLNLYPQTLPPGYSISTLVDLLEHPTGAKPEILPGFPKIRLRMMQAGIYKMTVRLSLITKSSCAGVAAEEIFSEVLRIQVNKR